MNSTLVGIIAVAGGAVALRYAWSILSPGEEPSPPEKPEFIPGEQMPPGLQLEEQQITLHALSQLWARGEVKTLRFDELSSIWREKRPREAKKERVLQLHHDAIMQFYKEKVKGRPYFVGDALEAVMDLLEFLDQHGDCPSVVNLNTSEPERAYDDDNYSLLAKVPLYEHSLNVACEVIRKLEKGPVVPKAVIAALGHDLGKIPHYQEKFYKSSAHPSTSLAVIEGRASVKRLKWFDEIASAIQHHHIQSLEYLDNVLREADQAARRYEMRVEVEKTKPKEVAAASAEAAPEDMPEAPPAETAAAVTEPESDSEAAAPPQKEDVATAGAEPAAEPKRPEPPKQTVKPEPEAGQAQSTPPKAAAKPEPPKVMPPPIAAPVEEKQRQRVPRRILDISEWFNAAVFVKELGRSINTTLAGDRFWSALELKGYVYFKPVPFYRLMIAHSKNNPVVVAAATSEQDRDDLIYSVIMELRKEKDLVATEFLGEGMFAAVFYHNPTPTKKGPKQFLIPFRAPFFGDEIRRAEARRNPLMMSTVALVPAFKTGAK